MYVPILFITLLLLVIFYGYFAISYQRDKKKLENVKNII